MLHKKLNESHVATYWYTLAY